MTPQLDLIVRSGNRSYHHGFEINNGIACKDGFWLSVIAGSAAHGRPRPPACTPGHHSRDQGIPCNFPGPFTHVEVGMPSSRPEPWKHWKQYAENPECPTETIYDCVPVEMVRALIEAHGGEQH